MNEKKTNEVPIVESETDTIDHDEEILDSYTKIWENFPDEKNH